MNALQMMVLEWHARRPKTKGEIPTLGKGAEKRDTSPRQAWTGASEWQRKPRAQTAVCRLDRGKSTGDTDCIALAEAEDQAALFTTGRKATHRMLQEEVVMAKVLVLSDAELAGELDR